MEELTHKQMQKMILFSCERINGDKEEINKINVFPVPDQDTGTNLAETLNGVKEVLLNKEFSNFEELGETALEGALIAAQGNTGIIYTGFLVGFFDGIKAEPKLNTKDLAIAFEQGFKRAKDSIQNPKKGTI
ncbi:MAG: DAK2 domain-containing protein, partial [Candidatus Pacebacteria bacterium]|nr:DAK2 domain-containing protein [Candidatus Paceibacterota bacterium]